MPNEWPRKTLRWLAGISDYKVSNKITEPEGSGV